jgi:hypothetical protein
MEKTTIQRLSELQQVIDEAKLEMHTLINESHPIFEGEHAPKTFTAERIERVIGENSYKGFLVVNDFRKGLGI